MAKRAPLAAYAWRDETSPGPPYGLWTVSQSVSQFVYLLTGLRKNYSTSFHRIRWKSGTGAKGGGSRFGMGAKPQGFWGTGVPQRGPEAERR